MHKENSPKRMIALPQIKVQSKYLYTTSAASTLAKNTLSEYD